MHKYNNVNKKFETIVHEMDDSQRKELLDKYQEYKSSSSDGGTDNSVQVFNNAEFGNVRAIEIKGEPWFVGKDVAVALGYSNHKKALGDHVDADDKCQGDGVTIRDPMGREQKPVFINESGLYSLIMGSKLEGAKRFKRWVTSEVLPAIRKNGGYIAGQEAMTPQELMAQALVVAQKTLADRDARIGQLEAQAKIDAPKVLFADSVATAKTTILIGEFAKILKQNGIEMGQHRLFRWLRDNGYLIKRQGADYNLPTQYSMELQLFEIKDTIIHHADGEISVSRTPKLTGKGQLYFLNKFLGEQA